VCLSAVWNAARLNRNDKTHEVKQQVNQCKKSNLCKKEDTKMGYWNKDTYLRTLGATRAWLIPARHAKEVKLRAAANISKVRSASTIGSMNLGSK
jgi:hypothetical protein